MSLLSRRVEQGRHDERMHRRSGRHDSPILSQYQFPKLTNHEKDRTYLRALHCEQAEEVVTKFNALLVDLKTKGYMEADAAK